MSEEKLDEKPREEAGAANAGAASARSEAASAEAAPGAEPAEAKAAKVPKAKGEKKPKAGEQPQGEKKAKAGEQPQGEKKAKASGGGKAAEKAKGGKPKGAEAKPVGIPKGYVPRYLTKYRADVVPAMMKKFNYRSPMEVPRIEKIVVNMGVGEAARNIKDLDEAEAVLAVITGQKPRLTRATRSVAAFKVRRGMPVGCCVTLRGWRMYDFLDRLISVAIPRVRDFRGLAVNAFDGRGNYSMGIREQLIFVEIDYNKVTTTRGMNVTTVTTARTDAECKELLTLFGMPFRRS